MKIKATFLLTAMVGAVSPALAAGTVYVPMGDANQIFIVDMSKDTVVGKIDGVPAVHGLSGTPDGKYLVAGSYEETGPDESTVPPKPKAMSEDEHRAHHAKRTESATGQKDTVSFVSIIPIADHSVVRRIVVPGAVHHTATTADSRYAVVTHPDKDGITVLDLSTFSVVKTIPTGPVANYAVASGDGKHVYISNTGNHTVSEIDTDSWSVHRNIVVREGPEHMVLSPDGRTLYVANAEAGLVSVVSLPQGNVVKTHLVGGDLHGIDLSDDGRTLFVSARERNKLVAIDLASGRMRSAPLDPSPYHLTVMRGTGKLYVSSAGEDKIWIVDQETLQTKGELPVGGRGHQMVVVEQ